MSDRTSNERANDLAMHADCHTTHTASLGKKDARIVEHVLQFNAIARSYRQQFEGFLVHQRVEITCENAVLQWLIVFMIPEEADRAQCAQVSSSDVISFTDERLAFDSRSLIYLIIHTRSPVLVISSNHTHSIITS